MIVAIADTHAALWYVYSDLRLGRAASAFIETTVASGDRIGLSAISIAEVVYLTERGRIPPTALNDIRNAVADPKAVLRDVPLDETIAMNMRRWRAMNFPIFPTESSRQQLTCTAYLC